MKMNKTGAAWLREHAACAEGFRWATSECATLREVWEAARPDWLIWVATRHGLLSDRDLWLFACWSAEQALPHWDAVMPDDRRPQVAIETRRRWLDGLATDAELGAAWAAAWGAAWDAAWDAAWYAQSNTLAAMCNGDAPWQGNSNV